MTFLIIIFSIFIIIVSNERSNTIRSVFILLLFILFLDKNLFKFKKIFLFLFFLISLTSLLLIPSLQQRYFTEINTLFINKYWKTSDSENSYSIIKNTTYGAHYLTGIAIFKENPWIGSGAKTFRLECHKEKYIDETLKFEGCSTHPHQLYIEFLSDLGSIGALIIVFFICYSLIRNLKIYFLKKHPVHLASILFIVASFLPLIPSGSFFTSFGATIFWINYSFMIFFEKITNE
jgi:O-antigen ligase